MKKGSTMQLPKATWFLLLIVVVFFACNGQKKTVMGESNGQSPVSPLALVMQGNYAGTDTVATHVIKSQKSLANFFSAINRTRKPGIPVPKVDFSKDMVVVYCSGNDGNGTIPTLNLANDNDSEMVLEMANKTPENGADNSVSPFSVYTMPLTPKKISFKAVE